MQSNDMESLDDKKILVLGAGDTGRSVVAYLQRLGARVRVADRSADPTHASAIARMGVTIDCGAFTDAQFGDAELVVASPGVAVAGPACDPAIARARAAGKKFVGDIELFAWEQARLEQTTGRRPHVIAITGSNGKSTVTAMAGAMCTAAGLDTVVAGNIGLPVLDAISGRVDGALPDAYVLELSSFQLETTSTLAVDAATLLNLSQDHLDRYASIDDYIAAKARIFSHADKRVVNRDDAVSFSLKCADAQCVSFGVDAPNKAKNFGVRDGALVKGDQPLIELDALPLAGLHNAANALAAYALVDVIGVELARATSGLRHFKGLPHRMARVREIDGVVYMNDSKGTNVGATAAALVGVGRPVVLIAGGEGKSQDFSALTEPLRSHAKALVLIGKAANAIASATASAQVRTLHAASMSEAVALAAQCAVKGDVVLLSPACASFDMFNNYAHRGDEFSRCVNALVEAGGANAV